MNQGSVILGYIMQLKPSSYLRLAKLPKITCGIGAGIRSQSSARWVNCCRARFLDQQQHMHKIWDIYGSKPDEDFPFFILDLVSSFTYRWIMHVNELACAEKPTQHQHANINSDKELSYDCIRFELPLRYSKPKSIEIMYTNHQRTIGDVDNIS